MSEPILRVKDLHKEFMLSHSGATSIKTSLIWKRKAGVEHLHVLKGITFDVNKGETLAVVGRNGAGKSTLLSLLARVYKPTSGTIEINGRVAPLLELGAGFHPDLTGLDNVFFNGVVLGLTRKQIEQRLDSIIEFSELRNHIDSPVRTYSSGMVARLGFAVAVHVDADLLLVDEVLAVGDYEFVQKCHLKIREFQQKGGSILLISHSKAQVRDVADRVLWLKHGHIVMDGDPVRVTDAYEKDQVDQREDL